MSIAQHNVTFPLAGGAAMSAYLAVPESGQGPGLLLLSDAHGAGDHARHQANLYAEEGWVVMLPDLHARGAPGASFAYDTDGIAAAAACAANYDVEMAARDLEVAAAALAARSEVSGGVGVVASGLGGRLAVPLARAIAAACLVITDPDDADTVLAALGDLTLTCVVHLPGNVTPATGVRAAAEANPQVSVYDYPETARGFDNRNTVAFDRPAAMMAKSRTLAALRGALGPVYDLTALWERHLYTEFAERNVEDSMDTMVDDPYVFVVPTVTGGTGKPDLTRWYSKHFHFQNPEDTRIVPISRTVGADRLVDEFIFCCTHDRVMDWLLPGVAPTHRRIEIPMVAVVNFRGEKLYHEHIWWDQASVLVQVGLLDPEGLPVTGAEQAAAMQDEHLPRNRLIPDWAQAAG